MVPEVVSALSDIRELMLDKAELRNRDERKIAGYRYVLGMVHESHDAIPVTPDVILQLHGDLYRFTGDGFAGRFSNVATPMGNEESVRAFFGRLVGTATKREIMDANPGMSQRTLERILSKLQAEGAVEKVGAARATAYKATG